MPSPAIIAANAIAVLAPESFKRAAGKQFVTPRAKKQTDRGRDWLGAQEIAGFEGAAGEQRAYLAGPEDAPRVFLQHGWEADSADLSTLGRAVAEAGFRAILIDGPAHGGSQGRTASMVSFAEGLARAAYAFGQPYALLAHSMGLPSGVIAMADHGLNPEAVIGLGAPASLAENVRFQGDGMGLSRRAVGLLLDAVAYRLEQPVARFAVANDAPRLSARGLFIHGASDTIAPAQAAGAIAAAWPGAETFILDDLGHRGVLRDERVIERALAFLRA